MTNEFGKFLKEARVRKGINQRRLALLSGIDPGYVNKLESGKMPPPSPKVLKNIASVLGIDELDLYLRAGYITDDLTKKFSEEPEFSMMFYALKVLSKEEQKSILDFVKFKLENWEKTDKSKN
ncbi:helix-turn-helix domain protein [Thermodesulfobium narugense DSM 14796]|uniref:Helix-turn-helix domain protein n=1 Tax=Thermodesulfobium narugense DSM 14796 TaxID=747365 RepID=M1E4P8_9BACT|nr:helix-turn-helix transcriptional regulator [Thermodesulfobium narugense]AEE14382.1 helix-turn-helix domain protein [Thermodesulfobium narugense DSM 14796]